MSKPASIHCLTPVYNDWESLKVLVTHLEKLQQDFKDIYEFKITVINDGSNEIPSYALQFAIPITVVHLNVNVGHQRAIAIGLQYLYNEENDKDYIVVLDSDGEDRPQDIPLLLVQAQQEENQKIVFAKRKKRQEAFWFKAGYFLYKKLFKYLTGNEISFGNFSVIPAELLPRVVYLGALWNHYSGSIIQSRLPLATVLLDRGKRYQGVSKMNFNSLVIHGLSSISIYFDQISVKILRLSLKGIGICIVAVLYILGEKLFTNYAIPGWASSLLLIISGIILQLFSMTLIVLLLQLSSRKNVTAPNALIYKEFIEKITKHEN